MSKSALTVLREARELISDPKRWTQGTAAARDDGYSCDPLEHGAKCWCALGAVARVAGLWNLAGIWECPATIKLDAVSRKEFGCSPASVNDENGHAAVLRMFDAAIASAEKEARS